MLMNSKSLITSKFWLIRFCLIALQYKLLELMLFSFSSIFPIDQPGSVEETTPVCGLGWAIRKLFGRTIPAYTGGDQSSICGSHRPVFME